MLRRLEREEYPVWLKEAYVCDEIIFYDEERKKIVWKDGIWEDGTWEYGTWENGTWKNGTWEDGIWKDGTWENGTWKGGTWEYGIWENGTWERGIWKDGIWERGIWKGGVKRFVCLFKFPIYYSSNEILVGCKKFTIEEMVKNREIGYFPFEDQFNDDEKKELKKAILAVLTYIEN